MTQQDPNNTFVTPVGRLVGGSLAKAQLTGFEGKVLEYPKRYAAIAIPKTDAQPLIDQIKRIADEAFGVDSPQFKNPKFGWGYVDGDSTDMNLNDKVYCEREGYPGCYVFSISNRFDFSFSCFGTDASQSIDPETVAKGYQIRLAGDIKANLHKVNPGMWLNLSMAQFIRKDTVISGHAQESGAAVFGDGTPVAQTPPPGTPVTAPPPAAPAPAHDVVRNAVAPPPPAPPAPDGPVLTEAGIAAAVDVAMYLGAGWTLGQLRDAGHIV